MSTAKTPAAALAAAKAAKAAATKPAPKTAAKAAVKAAPVKAAVKAVVAAKTAKVTSVAKVAAAPKVEKKAYRLLTGIDNEQFCQRVSDALADGYVLHGSPAITFNGKNNIVAQAIVLKSSPKKKSKKK